MRDLERLQDVVEYRINSSQLRFLILGVLAVTCAIFAVGVTVGKRLEPGRTAMAVDPLTDLDQSAVPQSDDEEETEPPLLTYHDELTERESARARRSAAPAEPEEEEEAAESPAVDSSPSSESEAAQPGGAGDDEAEEDGPVPSEPARPEEPEPGEASVYTLQVGSFETREEAAQFAANLRGRGHPTFLVRTSMPSRGIWFRVRVGPFHSRRDATRYQARFERQERLPTFLVRRRHS